MAGLFQGAAETSDDGRTDIGASHSAARAGSGFTLLREGKTSATLIGTNSRRRGAMEPFDATVVTQGNVPEIYVTTNSRLSLKEVSAAGTKMLKVAGLNNEIVERKAAFLKAVRLGHVLNSASQQVPRRAMFGFAGSVDYNYHANVAVVLGDDMRRYFRTMADVIATEVKELFDAAPTLDGQALETLHVIRMVAEERGLGRMPWFAFDAADAVTNEVSTAAERALIRAAKVAKVASVENVVDAMVSSSQAEAEVAAVVAQPTVAPTGGRYAGGRVRVPGS